MDPTGRSLPMNGGLRIERWIWRSPLVLGLGIAERGMVWREMDQLLLQEAPPNNTDHQRENEKEDHRKRKIIYLKSQTIPSRTGKFLPFCPYILYVPEGETPGGPGCMHTKLGGQSRGNGRI